MQRFVKLQSPSETTGLVLDDVPSSHVTSSTLRRLVLANTNLTAVGIRHISETLTNVVNPSGIHTLVLDNNPVCACKL